MYSKSNRKELHGMEADSKQKQRVRFITNIAFWIIILALVYVIFKYFINLVMPFFLALIFAALSRPIARWFSKEEKPVKAADGTVTYVPRKLHLPKNVAGVVSVVLLYLVFVGIAAAIVARIVDTGAEAIAAIPGIYYSSIQPGLEGALNAVLNWAGGMDESVLELIESAIPNIISSVGSIVTNFSGSVLVWISSFAGRLPSILLNTLICLIATVFIAVDFDSISSFLARNMPENTLRVAVSVKESFLDIVWEFIKSYFFIFLITASEISVILLIIGQKSAVLIGMLVAVFDAFPIVGSGMILLPWAVITLFSGNVVKGIELTVLYFVVVIVRQIIEPKIVGKHVGLRPIVSLFCMYVGTKLFGGLGLFALPIMAAIITDMNSSGVISLFKTKDK